MNVFRACHAILVADTSDAKLALVTDLAAARDADRLVIDRSGVPAAPDVPGRPERPRLVSPRSVPRRGVGSPAARAALLHSIAHIEFNAIHLAADAVVRFPAMPDDFHRDWVRVAIEEAKHFEMVARALRTRGYDYGSFEAHDGLWEMAQKTRDDPLARMALVPRVMEARGLDVTPGIRARFAEQGDADAVAILEVILAEEIGHVAIGNRWFHRLCAERGLDPAAAEAALVRTYGAPRPHRPLNRIARLAGGFTAAELDALEVESALARPD